MYMILNCRSGGRASRRSTLPAAFFPVDVKIKHPKGDVTQLDYSTLRQENRFSELLLRLWLWLAERSPSQSLDLLQLSHLANCRRKLYAGWSGTGKFPCLSTLLSPQKLHDENNEVGFEREYIREYFLMVMVIKGSFENELFYSASTHAHTPLIPPLYKFRSNPKTMKTQSET